MNDAVKQSFSCGKRAELHAAIGVSRHIFLYMAWECISWYSPPGPSHACMAMPWLQAAIQVWGAIHASRVSERSHSIAFAELGIMLSSKYCHTSAEKARPTGARQGVSFQTVRPVDRLRNPRSGASR